MNEPYTESGDAPASSRALVAIDFSEQSDAALDVAFELSARGYGVDLHVVSVGSGPVMPEKFENQVLVDQYMEAEEQLAAKIRDHVVGRAQRFAETRGLQPGRIACHARIGDPAKEVVELAAALDAALVVVGTHGRQGIGRALLGSVAEKVVRTAGCTVHVVKPKDHAPVDRPVVEIEPPRHRGERKPLGRRHTYHYLPRSMGGNMPLVYQNPIPRG